jgi:hypothetical protein
LFLVYRVAEKNALAVRMQRQTHDMFALDNVLIAEAVNPYVMSLGMYANEPYVFCQDLE